MAAAPPSIAIVVSRYNHSVTGTLLEGSRREYERQFGSEGRLAVFEAPGAFEIPTLVAAAARSGRFEGVVALGCIVKGETSHDHHLGTAVTTSLAEISVNTGVAVGLGVLTVDTPAQARARAGGDKGNKGAEAMAAAIRTVKELRAISSGDDGGPGDSDGPGNLPDKVLAMSESTENVGEATNPGPEDAARPALGGRKLRRLAFQALFQMDAGIDDADVIRTSLDPDEKISQADLSLAIDMAQQGFERKAVADAEFVSLAPEWPTSRQAAVDRAILRLAHSLIERWAAGETIDHPKVIINDCVEFTKEFSTERSPAFVNALLDKVLKRVVAAAGDSASGGAA